MRRRRSNRPGIPAIPLPVREFDEAIVEAKKKAAAAKKAREDEAEERALRLEVLKVAAGLGPGWLSPTGVVAAADLLLAWIRGETDGT